MARSSPVERELSRLFDSAQGKRRKAPNATKAASRLARKGRAVNARINSQIGGRYSLVTGEMAQNRAQARRTKKLQRVQTRTLQRGS
jgi:hypothetical protein